MWNLVFNEVGTRIRLESRNARLKEPLGVETRTDCDGRITKLDLGFRFYDFRFWVPVLGAVVSNAMSRLLVAVWGVE